MTFEEALEKVIAETGHKRYRWLTSKENPSQEQREYYRSLVISKATGDKLPQPSIWAKAKNAGVALVGYIGSGLQNVTDEVFEERMSICNTCEFRDEGDCTVCGCVLSLKCRMASEKCPLANPKWDTTLVKELAVIKSPCSGCNKNATKQP